MAWGQVSPPWKVGYRRLTKTARPKEGATFIVAASDSNNTDRADYVCDGTADEVEINQALNALPSTGGYVHLLEGTYSIASTITIPIDNVTIMGAGIGTRINSTFSGIMIIVFQRSNIIIRGLYLYGFTQTLGDYGIILRQTTDSIVTGCRVENSGVGIFIRNSSNCIVNDSLLDANTYVAFGGGIYIDGGLSHIISSNIFTSNSYGILNLGGGDLILTGNILKDNTTDGIDSIGDDNVITSNISRDNTSDGISITSSDNNVVMGNRCDGNGGWGITITNAASDKNIVVANQLLGNTTGALNDIGTLTELGHNVTA